MTGARRNIVAVDSVGSAPREVVLQPDAAARGALAARLGVPALPALTCRFHLHRDRADRLLASCVLEGRIVQLDVDTLEEFETTLHETAALRFVPHAALSDTIDPDDPVDEVGYSGGTVDLDEAMEEQLALSLNPYPRAP